MASPPPSSSPPRVAFHTHSSFARAHPLTHTHTHTHTPDLPRAGPVSSVSRRARASSLTRVITRWRTRDWWRHQPRHRRVGGVCPQETDLTGLARIRVLIRMLQREALPSPLPLLASCPNKGFSSSYLFLPKQVLVHVAHTYSIYANSAPPSTPVVPASNILSSNN